MSGISGIVYFEDKAPSRDMLQAMAKQMAHRGHDDQGVMIDEQMGFSFQRLSIFDLDKGHQPMSNEDDSIWIVFNGEIYNYITLKKQLIRQGHTFKTRTDTEVIIHLYEQYGEDCVKHLRGMFSFMIWDRNKRQLFGARDHFGIKPFYYYKDYNRFLFASEMKSILAVHDMKRTIATDSLLSYLSFQYVPQPGSLFDNIYKLPPAHTISISLNGHIKLSKYWDPMFEPEYRPKENFIEEIREKLKDSVKQHMQSDVELGCFLSSGIDSTAIAAYMARKEPIKTFSVGFEGVNNETTYAEQTAKTLGTRHYSKMISEDEFFKVIPQAVWHQDEPVADPSAIAMYHLAQLASRHVKVVLSGDGADELFGGNQIYREPKSLLPLSWMPKSMMGMMNSMVSLLPSGMKGRNYLMRGTTPLEERYIGNANIFSEDLKSDVLQHDRRFLYSFPNPADVVASVYDRTEHLDAVTRMQYLDMMMWLPGDILAKADKMTMAHGLELRVPYLDRKLFDVVKRIPTEYRIAEGTTKHIFRKAMEGIVPEPIIGRAKLGFPVPLREWLKGERGDELIGLIEQTGMEYYFNLKVIKEMLMKHRRGVADYSRHLWTLYIFSMWHMMNVQAVSYKDIASTSTVNYGRLWEREEQYSRLTEEQHVRL